MTQNKNSILQHWQPLVGIAAFLVAGGQFYAEMKTTRKDVDEIRARQDRQFQMLMEQQKSITTLEKQASYEEGFNKGKSQK